MGDDQAKAEKGAAATLMAVYSLPAATDLALRAALVSNRAGHSNTTLCTCGVLGFSACNLIRVLENWRPRDCNIRRLLRWIGNAAGRLRLVVR